MPDITLSLTASAALTALLLLPSPAAAQAAPAEECYDHPAPGDTPHGWADETTVHLRPFDPAWSPRHGDHYSRLVLRYGDETATVLRPAPGPYRFLADGPLTSWTICKAATPPPPPPTTAAPPPPTTAGPPATPVCLIFGKGIYDHDDPRCVPDPPPAPAPEAPAPPPEGPAPEPPAPARLPETGTGTRLALLGGATLSIGLLVELVTRYVLRRTPR